MDISDIKELPKRKHPRMKDFDYSLCGAYFITICTQNRRCLLSRIVGRGLAPAEEAGLELTSFGEIAKQQLFLLKKRYPFLDVDQYVIMPNHIHLLISLESDSKITVGRFVGALKSITANRWRKLEDGTGMEKLWQRDYYDHIIRNEKDYLEKLQYIDCNPDKWKDDELWRS